MPVSKKTRDDTRWSQRKLLPIGTRVDKLVVVSYAPSKNGSSRALCRCDCGNEKEVWMGSLRYNLKNNLTMTCGDRKKHPQRKIVSSYENSRVHIPPTTRFGTLVVLGAAPIKRGKSFSIVKCDCGAEKIAKNNDLLSRKINSCGNKKKHLKETCFNGHTFTDETTYISPNTGRRSCLICIKLTQKRARLKRNFGITLEERNQMFADQGYRCASCGTTESGSAYDWPVDHDHVTGKVRAVICMSCNTALGLMREDPVKIDALADYARRMCGKPADRRNA